MTTLPVLQLVTASYAAASPWSQLLTWTPDSFPTSPWWIAMQLYSSPELTTPVGRPVMTQVPYVGSGVWSTTASGAQLTAGTVYWIAVAAVNSATAPTQTGPWSNSLPLLYLGPPVVTSTSFDGASLTATWTPPPAGTEVNRYELALLGNGARLAGVQTAGTGYPAAGGASSFVFELGQLPLGQATAPITYQLIPLYVDPTTGATSSGPPASGSVYLTRPAIVATAWQQVSSGLKYQITALNQGYGSTAPPSFVARVMSSGTLIYQSAPLASAFDGNGNPSFALTVPAALPFFAGSSEIPAGLELEVALAQANSIDLGPSGAAAALLQTAPAITSASYQAGALAVELAAPAPAAALVQISGGAGAATIFNGRGSVAAQLTSGTAYTATATAISGQSAGPPSAAAQLMATPPTLTSVSYDGDVVRLGWQAASATTYPGLTGFLASVTGGNGAVARATVNGTAAALRVASGGEALVAQVQMIGAASTGPAATAAVLQATTSLTSAISDAASGLTTLSWPAVSGATSYALQLYLGDGTDVPWGAPIQVTGTSTTLATPLPFGAAMSAAITAQIAAGGLTTTGPAGAAARVMTGRSGAVAVDYDGSTALVSWQPVAGATGYTLTLLGDGAAVGQPFTAGASATSLAITPVLGDLTKTYTVVVQAQSSGSLGPPSAAAALFSPGYFLSSQSLTAAAPYVYPATGLQYVAPSGAAAPGMAETLYLPDLGGGTALTGLPITVGAFQLAASSTNAAYPYALSIAANSAAWQFSGQAIRSQLQQDYVSFLKACETNHANPLGIATLQQVIARYLPQTFQETLYYSYGLDLTQGYADLRPGMVLRVSFADYVTVAGTTAQWLNGYVGGATIDFDLGSYLGAQNSWLVGADAFIAQLVSSGMLAVTAPPQMVASQTQAGLADAADLFYPLFNQPFYRVFFPSQLATPWSPGSSLTTASFVIAAATSYTQLTQTVNTPSPTNPIAYFRGRAVIKLCIRVRLDGTEHVVPIGTTLRNLIERYGQGPPDAAIGVDGISLQRTLGPVVLDANARFATGQRYPVRYDWQTMTLYAPGYDPLALPLLHGDSVTLDGSTGS